MCFTNRGCCFPPLSRSAAVLTCCSFSSSPPTLSGPKHPPQLCGFFPLQRRKWKGLPVSFLSLWKHDYCFLCTPLIRARYARECFTAFFDWLASDPRSNPLMEFSAVSGEGTFHQLMVDQLRERKSLYCVEESWTRALFRPRPDSDAYLREAISGKGRRDAKRKERRLSEDGRVEYVELGRDGNIEGWAQGFLQLDHSFS